MMPASVWTRTSTRWNKLKKTINGLGDHSRLYFHDGDIWWVHLGANVGFEIDGKHRHFARPVIVLRQYNQYSFLALPLTTSVRPNRWRIAIGTVPGKEAFAVLSQLRNIDSLRLYQEIGHLDSEMLLTIQKAASLMNFG